MHAALLEDHPIVQQYQWPTLATASSPTAHQAISIQLACAYYPHAVHGHLSTKVTDLKATICAHHSSAAASLVGPDSCNAPSRRDGGGVHPPALATAARAISTVNIIGDVLDAAILPNHTRSGRAAKRSTVRPHDLHQVPVSDQQSRENFACGHALFNAAACAACPPLNACVFVFVFFCVRDNAPVAYMYTMQVQA
jgi:hypothetical protein